MNISCKWESEGGFFKLYLSVISFSWFCHLACCIPLPLYRILVNKFCTVCFRERKARETVASAQALQPAKPPTTRKAREAVEQQQDQNVCFLLSIVGYFFENKTPLIFFRSHCWLLFNMLFLFFNYSDWCIDRTTKMKYLVYIRHRDKNYMFKFISILTTDLSSVENKKLFCHSTWITWNNLFLLPSRWENDSIFCPCDVCKASWYTSQLYHLVAIWTTSYLFTYQLKLLKHHTF